MAKRNSSGRPSGLCRTARNTPFGRVTAGHGRHYVVTLDTGERLVAHRRGKKGDVAVGDRVGCTPPVSGIAAIETIEDRRTLLYRSDEWRVKTLAANADLCAVVFAPRPTFNPWFIWKRCWLPTKPGFRQLSSATARSVRRPNGRRPANSAAALDRRTDD